MKTQIELKNFPDTRAVEISGTQCLIPELTEENFWTLIEDYNELILMFNALEEKVELNHPTK